MNVIIRERETTTDTPGSFVPISALLQGSGMNGDWEQGTNRHWLAGDKWTLTEMELCGRVSCTGTFFFRATHQIKRTEIKLAIANKQEQAR